jgi:pSer/pThr/pTyr-binding forkhead associated (FHA) protein
MKFCRNCGATLAMQPTTPAMSPAVGAPMMAPPPGPYMAPPPGGPIVMAPSVAPRPAPVGSTITCPRCATPTPVGFAYCQQCGLHLNAIAPTDPGAGSVSGGSVRIRPPTGAPPVAMNPLSSGIDPQGATLASDARAAAAVLPIRPVKQSSGPASTPATNPNSPALGTAQPVARPSGAWGSAVLVNRDGSDGQRFPLTSEDTIVGRSGADIAFDEDRFLARQHARIARASNGDVKIHPIDTTNGVFKKTDGSVELQDGMIVLVGREVLRFERVAPEERTVHPLVRHGVALFGSPPRDPWARIVQLIPSGGARDVRHLIGEEVVLGREEGDIVFRDDAFMSRRHAAITWDGKRALLTDLGSSNGTFVRLTGPTSIKNGDHVRMGDQLMRIER